MEDCEEGGESEVEGGKGLNILGIAALEDGWQGDRSVA